MTTLKKIIFLNNKEKDHSGILTIESRDNNIFATIKTYGTKTLQGEYVLGIKTNNKIIKQNINMKENSYTFLLPSNADLNEKFGCVLLSKTTDKYIPLIWGSDKMCEYKESVINNINESMQKIVEQQSKLIESRKIESFKKDEKIPQTNMSLDESNNQNNMDLSYSEIAIASELNESLFESSDEEINTIINQELNQETASTQDLQNIPKGQHKFFDLISDQLYELFERYPEEENLSKLIDNSRWVKIIDTYDNINHIVGIIKEDNDIKYICYGVKGNYYQEPPPEMRGYSQWLPVDVNAPEENGYWTMYQDADTGENIPIN